MRQPRAAAAADCGSKCECGLRSFDDNCFRCRIVGDTFLEPHAYCPAESPNTHTRTSADRVFPTGPHSLCTKRKSRSSPSWAQCFLWGAQRVTRPSALLPTREKTRSAGGLPRLGLASAYPNRIREMVEEFGPEFASDKTALADKLIARREGSAEEAGN